MPALSNPETQGSVLHTCGSVLKGLTVHPALHSRPHLGQASWGIWLLSWFSPLFYTAQCQRPLVVWEAGSYFGSPPWVGHKIWPQTTAIPGLLCSLAPWQTFTFIPGLLFPQASPFSLRKTWVLPCLSLLGEYLDPQLLRALSRYNWCWDRNWR